MDNVYDVIIIGAGPAGMTSALYAKRGNLNTLIIEKSAPGGQLISINKLNNYPGYGGGDGASLAYVMYEQINALNVEFAFDEVINVEKIDELFFIKTLTNEYKCKNIIVATGTTYASLKIPNERKLIGKGISYCAVCDGKLFTNKDIAIVINEKHSLSEVFYLANYAKSIALITSINISKDDINNDSKITIYENYKVSKLFGNDNLEGIEIKKDEDVIKLDVVGLFPLIGSLPSNSFLSKYPIFSSNGYMNVDKHFQTSLKGLFGVGDVVDKDLRQVVTACSDGAIAAQYIASNKK